MLKSVLLLLALVIVCGSAFAETVKITNSGFARTTVAVVNSAAAQHHVFFTKRAFGADCGLYITDSVLAQSTVKVIKNAFIAQTTVRQVQSELHATSVVYLAKSPSQAFGHCDFAAALLVR